MGFWFYWVLVLLLMSLEDVLVYPRGGVAGGQVSFEHEVVALKTSDAVRLSAWFCPCPERWRVTSGDDRPVVLFLHGNGGTLYNWAPIVPRWQEALGADVLLLDYRGYGRSEGAPSEDGLYRDGQAAYDWLVNERGIDPKRIILAGRSLGGAVAIELACRVEHRALVLESTFTSLADAAANVYPWLPVHWVVRNRFPSAERIGLCSRPVFISHGDQDSLIPVAHAHRMHELANEPKRLLILPGQDHNSGPPKAYYLAVREFLSENVRLTARTEPGQKPE